MPSEGRLFPQKSARNYAANHMPSHVIIHVFMRIADLLVIAAYLLFITWFGARFKEQQRTLKDYFLGGRGAPWWAIAFSIVSAETSVLTVIGTPAIAYRGNFTFLQLILGYLLGRIVISVLFLPQYFRGELFTAYELMERRFGPQLRRLTAGIFLLLRAMAEGVRVFAVSIVVAVILGTGEVASIAVIVALTLFYTFEGGMTAVIWTDVMQMFLYIAGGLLSFFTILHLIPGGWPHVLQVGGELHKFQMFDFRTS
jgi:solute:Na+ symporter, SSS family